MLSMGSKQEEQTPLVPSENFLTMVILPYLVFSRYFAIYIRSSYSDKIIIFGGPEILQGVMRLHVRYTYLTCCFT